MAGIIKSNNILRSRGIAIAAAYATVDRGFKEYRNRVAERFGEETEREIRYNVKARKFIGSTEKDGVETENETIVNVAEVDKYSGYARFFDEASSYWVKDSEHNSYFLRAQERFANDRLIRDGYLFLNEVYEMLDIPRTKAGQIVGWVHDKKSNGSNSDNYVDFGIYDSYKQGAHDFVNGYERSILLDFNVDGNILDMIE
jgi:hypothetical protein